MKLSYNSFRKISLISFLVLIMIMVGWNVYGIIFNFVLSPEKQLEYYLAKKYPDVEFGYERNDDFEWNNNKIRWIFNVYPKDNEELKFEVSNIRMDKSLYKVYKKNTPGFNINYLKIVTNDDFYNVIIEFEEEKLQVIDISSVDQDENNAQIIYNALENVQKLNEKYKIKYSREHYITVRVLNGDQEDEISFQIDRDTYNTVLAKIEDIRNVGNY